MKKILVLATAALISVTGMTAMAQTDKTEKQCTKTEQCTKDKKECKARKGDKARRGDKAGKDMRQGKGRKASLNNFEGVNLTDEQVVLIEQLNQNTAAADSARRVQAKEQKSTDRDQAMKARKEAKRNYLNSVKSILTPEQYVVYLENIVVETPQQKAGRPGMQATKGQKGPKFAKAMKDRKGEKRQQTTLSAK